MNVRVIYFTNYPSPYRVEFFNQLGFKENIDLTVVFTQRPEAQAHRDASWFNTNYSHFQAVFCSKKVKLPKNKVYCPEVLDWVKKDFDEIIFGGYADVSFIVAMQYLKLIKKPFTLEVDGGLIKRDSKISFYAKRFLIKGAKRWVSSGKTTDGYLLHYGAKEEGIVHYPFSSMTEEDLRQAAEISQRKQQCRKNIGFNDGKYVLYVGQFVHRKGVDVLLESISKLPESIHFVLIGGNPTQEIIDYCKEKKLHNLVFPGFKKKDELAEYYAGADLFVLPTREDIWGLVINEAMSYGLPVVTTDRCVAGVELVHDDINGYVVETDNAKALADAIQKALSKGVMMGKESLSIIKEYSIENMVGAHVDILRNNANRNFNEIN